jgi:hypothetical protein
LLDADCAVVQQQPAYDTGAVNWRAIDTRGSLAAVRADAETLIWSDRLRHPNGKGAE